MGLLDTTTDVLYAHSHCRNEKAIVARARPIAAEGGGIIDVGTSSTCPAAKEPFTEKEYQICP